MQIFMNTIMAFYDRNPAWAADDISAILKVPASMIRSTRAFLGSCGMLYKDENKNWHITSQGARSLFDFDRDVAIEDLHFLQSAIDTTCTALGAQENELFGFFKMKEGMTNDSFVFYHNGIKYIYRQAGQGSEMLVDRSREYANYKALDGKGISDQVVYYNQDTGTKITRYIENCQNIDPRNPEHIQKSLDALRNLHTADIRSPHPFDFMDNINYYEKICLDNGGTMKPDYYQNKESVKRLLVQIDKMEIEKCFCHIDFVPGNCLLDKDENVVLIDWEYSGEQDPVADVAMFCVSAAFDKGESDELLQAYLQRKSKTEENFRFYTYIATAGLMWSLWSLYKETKGEVFDGYTDRVYSMCKEYIEYANKITDI